MWSEDKALEEDERTSAIAKRSSQGSRPTKMLIEGICSASAGEKERFGTHRLVSAVSWPKALGIVPAKPLLLKYLRSATQQARC